MWCLYPQHAVWSTPLGNLWQIWAMFFTQHESHNLTSFAQALILTMGGCWKMTKLLFLGFLLLSELLLETIIWFLLLILIIGLLEVDHLMAFAQGKQEHTYNITDQEMGEARDIYLGRKMGHILKYLKLWKIICLFASPQVPLVQKYWYFILYLFAKNLRIWGTEY